MQAMGIVVMAAGIQAGTWTLPQGMPVKDSAPRTYRFAVEYISSGTQGQIVRREQVTANYTRGLPGGVVRWNNVRYSVANGPAGAFGPVEKRGFMEGFQYRWADGAANSLKPEFFASFPPMAMQERNLVWDTQMLEAFGQTQFENLKLNQPYRFQTGREIDLAGAGRFQNRDVQLTWTGRTRRNGVECAVIDYQAFFNPFAVDTGGLSMKARSHYWGQVWVSLETKQIEYGTLYEDVFGEMKLPGQEKARVVSIFRTGTFEPATGK